MKQQIIERFPGISCAWMDAVGKTATECYGVADKENCIPVDSSTIFPACSISKFVTAICIMKLHEQNLLDVDMPVNQPIIVDFNVLKKYQRRGIGNRLMDAAERAAGQYADTVCLGVGVCDSYGTAQRMYVKRGYIPDGSGVWYQGRQCVQYETVCTVDDDLILFFSKQLNKKA